MIGGSFYFPQKCAGQSFLKILAFIFFLTSQSSPPAYCQTELGQPYITSWLPKDYNADGQNWAIVQDQRGVMYFGNLTGILEYDGVSWRLIQFPNRYTCRSLATDENGRVYAGGYGDFGYLAPDSLGQMHFVSMLPQVPDSARNFADVWCTRVVQGSVYFSTLRYVFRWTPSPVSSPGSKTAGEMKSWQRDNTFRMSFVVDDVFYIRERERGLLRMQADSLRLMPGSERFGDAGIFVMLPFGDIPPVGVASRRDGDGNGGVQPGSSKSGVSRRLTAERSTKQPDVGNRAGTALLPSNQILIGTREKGLFLYDGLTFHPFKTEADEFLQKNQLALSGAALSNSCFLLNTLSGGAVVLDRGGKLLQVIDRSSGLPDNTVNSVYCNPAQPQMQWLALNNGIARMEATGAFSLFGAERGLESFVYKVQRYRGVLYAATNVGIFYLDAASGRFKPVNMPVIQAWDFLSIDGELLAATHDGVYEIDGDQAIFVRRSINTDFRAAMFYRSRCDSQRVFVGLFDGLAALRHENGVWRDEGRAPGIQEEIRTLVETDDGKFWAGTSAGVLRLTFPPNISKIWQDVQVEHFGQQHGLPEGWMQVNAINGAPYFVSDKVYRFDDANQRFVVDSSSAVLPPAASRVLSEEKHGQVWIKSNGIALCTRQTDGCYQWLKTPFLRFSSEEIYTVYSEENGIVWFGGDELIRYDLNVDINTAEDYPALVRRVLVDGDSLIYGGTAMKPCEGCEPSQGLTLAHTHNNLTFQFSASAYEDAKKLQFQTWLEGFGKDWSGWTNKTEKEYTNLPEGDYQFRVRAKNIYDHVSQEAGYAFIILPPWYRTWWAYVLYILSAGGIIFGLVRIRVRSLHKKTEELEKIVTARTKEVTAQKEQIEEQAEKLREMDNLKSRFFANISHEFRTPLTLISGPVDSIWQEVSTEASKSALMMIRRNANRLLRLINQILDLSKLEAGKLQLHVQRFEFNVVLRSITAAYESQAKMKNVELAILSEHEELFIFGDQEKLENILHNLISNALKFTPEGGRIEISLAVNEKTGSNRNMVISVKDSGRGISPKNIGRIFDRFYQVEDDGINQQGGSGIGLALVKELTELLRGTITVESEPGKGTIFTLTVPLDKSAFKESELADTPDEADSMEKATTDLSTNVSTSPENTRNADAEIKDESGREIILFIEDNADVRAYVKGYFARRYQWLEAKDGEAGVAKACEIIPDLVISDLMMPKMNGYEVCRALKTDERTSHIPVILLTARAAQEDKLEGLETGADDYLIKPFDCKELLVRVSNLIQLRRTLRERFSQTMLLKPNEVSVTPLDQAFLEKVMQSIESHMADEAYDLSVMCHDMAMSERQLQRKLKAITDQRPNQFIRFLRLQRARELLEKQAGTISDIAYMVGFSSVAYFTRCFREQYGKPPSELKNEHMV